MTELTYAFLDTMIYMHYKPISDIPFSKLLSSKKVIIVIPRITLQELDKHKNTHESRKIRDRVSKRLKYLRDVIKSVGQEIDHTKTIHYHHDKPTIDFRKYGLDPQWNDDLLLATILHFKQSYAKEDVILFTQDSGPMFGAEHLGINCIELSEDYKLPVEEDPLIKQNRQLKNDLMKIKAASPNLIFSLSSLDDGDNYAEFFLEKCSVGNRDKGKILADVSSNYPRKGYPEINDIFNNQSLQGAMNELVQNVLPSREEFKRYNNDVEKYIQEYEEYLDALAAYETIPERCLKLEIEIQNIGQQPAEDIDLTIHFPDGFTMYSEDELKNEPQEPEAPIHPRAQFEMYTSSSRHLLDLGVQRLFPDIQDIDNSFNLRKTNSYELEMHFERIKHGYAGRVDTVYILFDSYETANSFSFEYSISAANIHPSVNSKFNIVVKKT